MGAGSQPEQSLYFVVQEYMANGDVQKLLQNHHINLSLCRRMVMAKDAALGINWLHCNNPVLVHRDLKTSNCVYCALNFSSP